jgi:hypothetical protein
MLYTDKIIYAVNSKREPLRITFLKQQIKYFYRYCKVENNPWHMISCINCKTHNFDLLIVYVNRLEKFKGRKITLADSVFDNNRMLLGYHGLTDERFELKKALEKYDVVLTPSFVYYMGTFWNDLTNYQRKEILGRFTFNTTLSV